jgi:uncharacterized protein YndB with AHSA1/START domain
VAEPRRRQILDVLAGGERPVNDLVRLLGLSQPLVSKHLVYKAWSTPELVKRWWSGKPRRDDARRDRPSGWGRVAIRDGDGGRIVEVAFHGEYREIFPDERIISTEVYEGMPGGEALNTVMFTEAEGRGRAHHPHGPRAAHEQGGPRRAHIDSGMETGMREGIDLLERMARSRFAEHASAPRTTTITKGRRASGCGVG